MEIDEKQALRAMRCLLMIKDGLMCKFRALYGVVEGTNNVKLLVLKLVRVFYSAGMPGKTEKSWA